MTRFLPYKREGPGRLFVQSILYHPAEIRGPNGFFDLCGAKNRKMYSMHSALLKLWKTLEADGPLYRDGDGA